MEELTIDFSRIGQSTSSDQPDSNTARFGLRKSTRARSSSTEESLHKTNRRTIAKPKKMISVDSSEKDIKNFYLNINKKKINVKPAPLETINEEENEDILNETTEDEANLSINSFLTKKSRKLKRSLSLNDGLNINKALQTKRKNRIKKVFGKRTRSKKIKMSNFMSYLKSLEDSSTNNAVDKFGETSNSSTNSCSIPVAVSAPIFVEMEDDIV